MSKLEQQPKGKVAFIKDEFLKKVYSNKASVIAGATVPATILGEPWYALVGAAGVGVSLLAEKREDGKKEKFWKNPDIDEEKNWELKKFIRPIDSTHHEFIELPDHVRLSLLRTGARELFREINPHRFGSQGEWGILPAGNPDSILETERRSPATIREKSKVEHVVYTQKQSPNKTVETITLWKPEETRSIEKRIEWVERSVPPRLSVLATRVEFDENQRVTTTRALSIDEIEQLGREIQYAVPEEKSRPPYLTKEQVEQLKNNL